MSFFDPQQLNRYSFERNNPLRYVDPTGHAYKAGPDDAVDVVNDYLRIFIARQEANKLREKQEYDALYSEYQGENSDLPEDGYYNVLNKGNSGAYITRERRMSLEGLRTWKNERNKQLVGEIFMETRKANEFFYSSTANEASTSGQTSANKEGKSNRNSNRGRDAALGSSESKKYYGELAKQVRLSPALTDKLKKDGYI